jgi:hypothetical protein
MCEGGRLRRPGATRAILPCMHQIGDGILAPKMHLHRRECAGRVLEDSMGMDEVE